LNLKNGFFIARITKTNSILEQIMKVKFEKRNLISPIVSSRVCPVCGELNKRMCGFCMYCNEHLNSQPGQKKGQSIADTGKRRVLVTFMLIFIVILVAYILLKNGIF